MKHPIFRPFTIVALTIICCFPGYAQQVQRAMKMPGRIASPEGFHHIVSTTEVAADLSVHSAQERITGRASFHLIVSPKSAETGQVFVRGFNMAFFGVPQSHFAGEKQMDAPLGLLGFAVMPGKGQQLRYDAKAGRITGTLRMYADASALSRFARQVEDGKSDLFVTPTPPVVASIDLALERPVSSMDEEYVVSPARLNVKLRGEPFRYDDFEFPAVDLSLREVYVKDLVVAQFYWFEVGRSLCVQPVRTLRFRWIGWYPFFQLSGAGLSFGEPGARAEWAKADVVFNIRDWKTVFDNDYWELTSGEAGNLRAEVDDDDCIEVFFVNDFDPDAMWGGGATWGGGTASSKIISSDGNARGGVDFTHLAHELGHVLGLHHPGAAAAGSLVPASTGTLLCPSGYLNDNPAVNSQENKDLLSNPLLVFTIKLRSAGPDCADSADCGACP